MTIKIRVESDDPFFDEDASSSDIVRDLMVWARERQDGWTFLVEAAHEIERLRAVIDIVNGLPDDTGTMQATAWSDGYRHAMREVKAITSKEARRG